MVPLSKLPCIGEEVGVSNLKWILNDLFLMLVTEDGTVAIMDTLLYAY